MPKQHPADYSIRLKALASLSPQQIAHAVLSTVITDTNTNPTREVTGQALLLDQWLLLDGMISDPDKIAHLIALKEFAEGKDIAVDWKEISDILHEEMETSRRGSILMTHAKERGLAGLLEVDLEIEAPRTADTPREDDRLMTAQHNGYRDMRDQFIHDFVLPAFELADKKMQAQKRGRENT
jgi:hypothetical protein